MMIVSTIVKITFSNFLGANVESESNDRDSITLPGKQLQLVQDAVEYG